MRNKFCDGKHNVPYISPPEINFPMTSFEPATAEEVKNWFFVYRLSHMWPRPFTYQIIEILSRCITYSHHDHCQFVFGIRLFSRCSESIVNHAIIQ